MSKLSVISLLVFVALTVAFMNGCEVDSATETIVVTPSSVTVKKGQTVQFTASGGYEYTWSLGSSSTTSNSLMGTLSSTMGPTVTYTSLYSPTSSNDVQIETLTVSSMIPGDATSTNSSASTQGSGKAIITHLGL